MGQRRYFTFGKYKHCSVEGVIESNPKYAIWAHWNVEFFELTNDELHRAEINIARMRGARLRLGNWTYDVDDPEYQDWISSW